MKATNQYVTKPVFLDLNEVIGLDLEGFLNLLEEKWGGGILEDISYRPVAVHKGEIIVEVTAKEVEL